MTLVSTLRSRLLPWREEAIDLALLLAALVAADRASAAINLPGTAMVAVLFMGALLLPHGRPDRTSPGRALTVRLPALLGVAAGAAALFRLWFDLPWPSLVFAPIWAVLELLYHLGWRGYYPVLRDWCRRRRPARDDIRLGQALLVVTLLGVAGGLYPDLWSRPLGLRHGVVLGGIALALVGYRAALRLTRGRADAPAENCRWLVLGLGALLLLRGLIRATVHGAGDAIWYGTMLADMVAQTRAGIFPVWLGQSIYQFDGAIYPLRVAPAFHYLGALLDLLTAHTLGVFALQNLLLALLGGAAIFSAYFTLRVLLPGRPWLAVGLAALFLACPGVLAIAYASDLFMSWTTLPLVPLVWFATVQSGRDRGSLGSMLLLGTALGLCWWGHSPIALWMTLFAGIGQVVRCVGQRPDGRAWRHAAAGAIAFAAIAAYPIGSVLFFPPEAGIDAAGFQRADPGGIASFLQAPDVFPGIFLPLNAIGRGLASFQLGYALWGVLLFSLWHLRRSRRWEARTLLGIAALVVLLLAPLPGLDTALWSAVPGFIRNPTGNWVMNRLYLVLAGAVVYGFAAVADDLLREPRRRHAFHLIVALGCLWSLAEAAKFAKGSQAEFRTAASARDLLRPENVVITRFSYLVFPKIPAYFTHGVADPELENRLARDPADEPNVSNLLAARAAAAIAGEEDFSATSPASDHLETPPFHLLPGKRYLLACDFFDPGRVQGVLRILGTTLSRQYALPEYGEPDSFGIGGQHPNLLSVWTSNPAGEDIRVQFSPGGAAPADLLPLGRVTCLEYDPERLPVRMLTWLPYRARVRTPETAWLETPRMYQQGYRATVNGQPAPVRKSAQGLVAIQVPAGTTEVALAYRPPPGLAALFWISWIASLGCVGGLAADAVLRARRRAI